MKTVEADFDPGQVITLNLYPYGTDVLLYGVALAERVNDLGSYWITQAFLTGRYRSALIIGSDRVQRSRIYVGPNEDTTYHIGNWEGSVDIGQYYFAGTGAYTLTLTVVDNLLAPIEGAYVSLYRGGDQRHGLTNAAGQVIFFSNAVTWTDVSVVASGFTFVTAPIIVIANAAITYTGVVNSLILPPLAQEQVHVQSYVFNEFGQLENGVEVHTRMIQPSTLSGIYDKKKATYTSVVGVVTLTNLFQDAVYDIWRGQSTPMKYRVPITTDAVIEGPPILGDDENDPCA